MWVAPAWLAERAAPLHRRRGAHVAIAVLRLLIGFAFLPAGLKKVLGEPFTDPGNHGRFHDFLHAFYATGWFYGFVGAVQLTAAALLMTQRWAWLGALIALPVLTAIAAFCWSTGVVPTATVVTLMWLGTVGLLGWEASRSPAIPRLIDNRWWAGCGLAIIALYVGVCLAQGEVVRPRGANASDPVTYLMPTIALLPLVTWWLERRHRDKRRAAT